MTLFLFLILFLHKHHQIVLLPLSLFWMYVLHVYEIMKIFGQPLRCQPVKRGHNTASCVQQSYLFICISYGASLKMSITAIACLHS